MQNDIWHSLIGCGTCPQQVSVLADKCPNCGAPNEWVHPLVARLKEEQASLSLKAPFSLNFDKTKVWGETRKAVPLWAEALAGLLLIGGSFFGFAIWGIWGAFVAGGLAVLPILLSARNETFAADMRAACWSSSNDDFWLPVRAKLQLPKP